MPSLVSPRPGYRPCDPKVIRDRVSHLDMCRRELQALAARRKALLEQSRALWQCLRELDEAEDWIKEQEQICSALDYGKDLAGVLLLQRRHAALEAELEARGARLERALMAAKRLADAGREAGLLQDRAATVRALWVQLQELVAFRRRGLRDAEGFFQFQAEAEELAEVLADARRRAASEELGHDEARTQALLREHQELQAGPEAQSRLAALRALHAEVVGLAELRGRRLQDALDLYTVFGESEACHLWMASKERWLEKLEVPAALEDLDLVQHR